MSTFMTNDATFETAKEWLTAFEHERQTACSQAESIYTAEFATYLDSIDPLHSTRELFNIPRFTPAGDQPVMPSPVNGNTTANVTDAAEGTIVGNKHNHSSAKTQPMIYMCGNSLGLMPRKASEYVNEELSKWSVRGVEGHFEGARPWVSIDERSTELSSDIVGADDEIVADKKNHNIAICNSLSVNLHLLMITFFAPTEARHKIIMEEAAFCSDHHVIRSQLALHNLSSEKSLIQLKPRENETYLRTEDICEVIRKEGNELALVLLPGIQFYTGQFFDIEQITRVGHEVGAVVGWDLAHAVGNVPILLNKWNVDFAAWCSYKYLNAGPGSIGGLFVHPRHAEVTTKKRLAGWWGQTASQRFLMQSTHVPVPGAQAYMLSNPPVLPTVCLQASLEVFHDVGGIKKCRAKSLRLTSYLELLLQKFILVPYSITILTPPITSQRGAQLSLLLPANLQLKPILRALEQRGAICDGREPNVIRVSPAPLYNTFSDVFALIHILATVLKSFQS